MKSNHGRWSFSVVRLDGLLFMFWFLKKLIYKAFGSLTRCKLDVKKEEWPCTKSECAIFFYMPRKGNFERKKNQVRPFSCLCLLFPKTHFSAMGPCLFLLEHLFCLSHRKTCWAVLVDNVDLKVRLLGTSNFTVTLTFFPWHKPKWSCDEFNNQSQVLQGLGTTSWSMV